MLERNSGAHPRLIKLSVLAAVFCLTLFVVQPASADPISGEIAFGGLFSLTGGSGPQDYLGATGIDFGFSRVVRASGDFSANGVIPFVSPVTMNDFTFMPFSGPIDPLWSVGIFEFALQSLTDLDRGQNYLALAGTGVVSASKPGLDDTAFDWKFLGGSKGGQLQLFVSKNGDPKPKPLPEPSSLFTLTLLVAGLGTVCLRSRRNQKAPQH